MINVLIKATLIIPVWLAIMSNETSRLSYSSFLIKMTTVLLSFLCFYRVSKIGLKSTELCYRYHRSTFCHNTDDVYVHCWLLCTARLLWHPVCLCQIPQARWMLLEFPNDHSQVHVIRERQLVDEKLANDQIVGWKCEFSVWCICLLCPCSKQLADAGILQTCFRGHHTLQVQAKLRK